MSLPTGKALTNGTIRCLSCTMRPAITGSRTFFSTLARKPSSCRRYSTTRPVDSTVDIIIDHFRNEAFSPGRPWLFKNARSSSSKDGVFPAFSKWFDDGSTASGHAAFSPYMNQFAQHIFPYELTTHQNAEGDNASEDPVERFTSWLQSDSDPVNAMLAGIVQGAAQPAPGPGPSFSRFDAPFQLLLKALEFNRSQGENPLKQLYIAQAPLSDLPAELQRDLPTPRIVEETGKGDVYSTSVWMGLEPTYTSLHRDPNPNLLCQLLGRKTVKLMSPKSGDKVYRQVQAELGQQGNSRIRGLEMMQGPERVALDAVVWGSVTSEDIVQVPLDPGDALFIPTGWWHSVKSAQDDGRLNVSANWWFR